MKRNRNETEERRIEQLLSRLEGAVPAPAEDELRAMARAAARHARTPEQAAAGGRVARPRPLRWSLAVAVALVIGSGFGFALGASQTPEGAAAEGPVGLGFLPAEGWNILQTAAKPNPSRPVQQAIAANVPLRPEDDVDGIPYSTLLSLPRHGVVIVASFMLAREHAGAAFFPARDLPLRLRDAAPPPDRYAQLRPALPLSEYQLRAKVNGYAVEVSVYFGTDRPTPDLITAGQRQLDRLVVRPPREDDPLDRALPMRAGSATAASGTGAASRIVDRTFRCTPVRAAGGVRSFDVDAVPVGETDSFTRNPRQGESPGFIGVGTGPWVLGSELVAVRARSWLRFPPSPSPPGVYASVGRCVARRVSLPLSPRGLPGPPVPWAERSSCFSRGRVLVRVRAVLQAAASWRRANRSYDGARSNVVEAAIAIRSERRRQPLAFVELGPAGKTRLWVSSDCT
jgi:hypothetical protein